MGALLMGFALSKLNKDCLTHAPLTGPFSNLGIKKAHSYFQIVREETKEEQHGSGRT